MRACCLCERPASNGVFCWRHGIDALASFETRRLEERSGLDLPEENPEEVDWRELVWKYRPRYQMRVNPDLQWAIPLPRERRRYRIAADPWHRPQEHAMARAELREKILDALTDTRLTDTEIMVLVARFGIGGFGDETAPWDGCALDDVAALLGRSRERVRQIETKALLKVRRGLKRLLADDFPEPIC